MQLFYVPELEHQDYISLGEEESKHAIKVLRLKQGDTIHIVNGRGIIAMGRISEITSKKCCEVQIIERNEHFGKRDYYLHIAIAPTKNMDRIEYFVEKSVEIGIDEISFIICNNSERTRIRIDRLEKIMISAMKQSLKAYKTLINTPMEFEEFTRKYKQGGWIAHCRDYHREVISNFSVKGKETIVLIGPEGDFSENEVQLAMQNGFRGLSLGESRLRTETAGLVACSGIYLMSCQ
ncbi:MAG: 16S rRNA (uracil(1498)-N(3))-methyltransferase [Bacteroidota bacterium]